MYVATKRLKQVPNSRILKTMKHPTSIENKKKMALMYVEAWNEL